MSGFVHRAFFYRDEREWLDEVVPFVRDGLLAGEPVLVAVASARVELLLSILGGQPEHLEVVSMEAAGKNPGRIISLWYDFADRHHDAPRLRGVGEPVWPGRRADEVVECQHHEQLLNVAFADRELELVCPYDVSVLPDHVVEGARRSHPFAGHARDAAANPAFLLEVSMPDDLTPCPPDARSLPFGIETLRQVRRLVEAEASLLPLDPTRVGDLLLAVGEAATNSVQYGDGGVLSVWSEPDRLVCEIRDNGRIVDPLVGRRRPAADAPRGRGVWMVHQMCDLVQIRSAGDGTRVRLAFELDDAARISDA